MFFFNIPQHGDLHLDKILFSFENVPMIFVCRNNKNEYFLCQCVDVITGISWMITPVSTKLLIRMIKDEISMLTAFRRKPKCRLSINLSKACMKPARGTGATGTSAVTIPRRAV